MKNLIFTFVIITFLVSCAPQSPSDALAVGIPNPSSSPTPVGITPSPTSPIDDIAKGADKTNIEKLPVVQPSQTLTPYPTFDVSAVKTQVPAEPVLCPPENQYYKLGQNLTSETFEPTELVEVTERELESGGSFSQVEKAIEDAIQINMFDMVDLTGDGVAELIVWQFFGMTVLGCNNAKSDVMLKYSGDFIGPPAILSIQDMNLNGVPDIVVVGEVSSGFNASVDILEWDGNQFNSLIQANHGENSSNTSVIAKTLYWYNNPNWQGLTNIPMMEGHADIEIRDTDNNGTKELIFTDNGPGHVDSLLNFGPWRGKKVEFLWDGIHYLYSSLEIDPPIYRYQAIQDADRYYLLGEYDKAVALYQDAIFSDKLEWWSKERMDFMRDTNIMEMNGEVPPISPQPNDDEYSSIAGYARYRIFLYHLSRGWLSDAETTYWSLIEYFPVGTTGSKYAQLATILRNEYQKTNDLHLSCEAVIDYVYKNKEILAPLGDINHGLQSHIYFAQDVCPY